MTVIYLGVTYIVLLEIMLLYYYFVAGSSLLVNVSLNSDGFFLEPENSFSAERHFIPSTVYANHIPSLYVSYGGFGSVHKIPLNVWKPNMEDKRYLGAIAVGDHNCIRAYVVGNMITFQQHELYVIFHAFERKISQQKDIYSDTFGNENRNEVSQLCMVTAINNQFSSMASKCVIYKSESHCVTSTNLLDVWRTMYGIKNVTVWYFVQYVVSMSQCEDIRQDVEQQLRNSNVDKAALENEGIMYLASLPVLYESPKSRRYAIDNSTLFYFMPPQRPLHVGQAFSVSVRLQQFGDRRTGISLRYDHYLFF